MGGGEKSVRQGLRARASKILIELYVVDFTIRMSLPLMLSLSL